VTKMTISTSREHVIDLTSEWMGERDDSGRPRVPDAVLERLKKVTTEHAWHVLDARGYPYQFTGGWRMSHPGRPLVGRALTSFYLPHRPDLERATREAGEKRGFLGGAQPNAWVVDLLTEGDVMVADIFGKIVEGTVIGDNLGTSIAARTHAGAVIDGGVRDLTGLQALEDVNFYFREAHPTPIKGVVLAGINTAVSIGGVTVLPGDVVFGTDIGVTFIPSHLAQEVVDVAEEIDRRDRFGKQRLAAGVYTSAEIDLPVWAAHIDEDYARWMSDEASA
jgi:4-hydroxy-4-methyl-2-oxoglutarate aldolase